VGSVLRVLCGVWCGADGGQCMVVEIMTSRNVIVSTISLVWPLRRDHMMPHGHGVDNCCIRPRRKGRSLELGEYRSPTQTFKQDLLRTSHRLWAYVCELFLGLIVIMAMLMAMIMLAMVMVITVQEPLRQVGWLRQR